MNFLSPTKIIYVQVHIKHQLLQVKLLKCEVELLPKDRRKEALKMRKDQLERLWQFYLSGVVNVTNADVWSWKIHKLFWEKSSDASSLHE